ncbi:unnamed protein product [Caenorhabditis brenneri]
MMLVWGTPDSTESSKKNSSFNWDECIDNCFSAQECVLAWQSGRKCLNYNYNAISPVSQTDSVDGSIVAWKVNISDSDCPSGINPPTFDNQNATGKLFVDYDTSQWPAYIDYNIYMDGNKWKVSYSVMRSCTPFFMEVLNHEDGSSLCVSVIFNDQDLESFDFDYSKQSCEKNGAYLARLVYPEDFEWFQSTALTKSNIRGQLSTPDSYARIDGKRTVKCQSTPKSEECMSPTGFEFTGPPVPHFDNYNWVTNSSAMETPDDNCLVLVFNGTQTPKVDVRGCSTDTSPLHTSLIFCSNSAWIFVSQTDSAYGSVVAWKVNSPDDQCPTGQNPPTFDNQNATGTLFVEATLTDWPMYVYYNIYMDGDKWKMSYSTNRSCGNTFIEIVNHQDGSGICTFEWFNKDNTSFSYNRGIELCQEKVAYLAGIVYPEDFEWFQDYASTNLRSLIKTPDTYARIDGKRTAACQATPTTSECMSVAGFDFLGPPVPHFDNYNWVTNSSAMATPDDNCLVIVFKGNETPKVDVRGCSSSTSPLSTQFLFCSHTAWTYEAEDYD